jgi:hypothetical protein
VLLRCIVWKKFAAVSEVLSASIIILHRIHKAYFPLTDCLPYKYLVTAVVYRNWKCISQKWNYI